MEKLRQTGEFVKKNKFTIGGAIIFSSSLIGASIAAIENPTPTYYDCVSGREKHGQVILDVKTHILQNEVNRLNAIAKKIKGAALCGEEQNANPGYFPGW